MLTAHKNCVLNSVSSLRCIGEGGHVRVRAYGLLTAKITEHSLQERQGSSRWHGIGTIPSCTRENPLDRRYCT